MRDKQKSINLACQIVFNQPKWDDKYISDMLATYEPETSVPCSFFELNVLCCEASKHKSNGLLLDDIETIMQKE